MIALAKFEKDFTKLFNKKPISPTVKIAVWGVLAAVATFAAVAAAIAGADALSSGTQFLSALGDAFSVSGIDNIAAIASAGAVLGGGVAATGSLMYFNHKGQFSKEARKTKAERLSTPVLNAVNTFKARPDS